MADDADGRVLTFRSRHAVMKFFAATDTGRNKLELNFHFP
jgi:hypothetical protein